MAINRIYESKIYEGKSSDRPHTLPYGDFFWDKENKKLYIYDENKLPLELNFEGGGLSLDQVQKLDNLPTDQNSVNNLLSNGKQDLLNSGINIKTIDGESVLGSGNIETSSVPVDLSWDPNTRTIINSSGDNTTITLAGDTTDGLMSTDEHNKLMNIETGATADQTPEEIEIAYESRPDTNKFTNSEKIKLANLSVSNVSEVSSRKRLIQTVLDNKFTYPTPVNTVVVNNLSELQAQENAPNGTEIRMASGLVIDISNTLVRLDFNNEVYLTSDDINNKATILLGELGSNIRFSGHNSMAYDFNYSGTWVYTTRPISPDPDTVGIVVNGANNFKAYNLNAEGFSYAAIDFKDSINSHVESCNISKTQATGLGYCIVLNGESTITAYKNHYSEYRHTIAKASDSPLQGYTDYKSYVAKGGNVGASYAYDSHGEPDSNGLNGVNEFAGDYMNVIDCYFEDHIELCIVSRGIQRTEMVISGNTFVRGNRTQAIRQIIQGSDLRQPNEEENVFDLGDNIYIGQPEDTDISINDSVIVVEDEGLFKYNLFTKEKEKLSSNRAANFVFSGNFTSSDEILTINGTTIQIYKKGVPVKTFNLNATIKGAKKTRVFQNTDDELVVYSDTEIIRLNFSSGSLVQETLLSGLDINFILMGTFKAANSRNDIIVASNNGDHNLYPNNSSSFDPAELLGSYSQFDSGYEMSFFNNGFTDIVFYDSSSKQGYRTRVLSGLYRSGDPALRFTIDNNDDKFFVKNINGNDRLFNYGEGGMLKVFLESSSGFGSPSLLNIGFVGSVNLVND